MLSFTVCVQNALCWYSKNNNRLPAVGEDRKHFIVVLIPVLALADEPTESGKPCFSVLNGDLFTLAVAKQNPVADQLDAERALRLRRRHELCNDK